MQANRLQGARVCHVSMKLQGGATWAVRPKPVVEGSILNGLWSHQVAECEWSICATWAAQREKRCGAPGLQNFVPYGAPCSLFFFNDFQSHRKSNVTKIIAEFLCHMI